MVYTYDGIKAEIKAKLSLLSNWNTTLYYGVYDRIVDLLAYTADKLVYLAEFYFQESKWTTATKKSSLTKLAKWLSYVPYRKTGAIGTIQLSASSTFNQYYSYTGKEVLIPKWTRFTDTSNILNTYAIEDTYYYTGQIGSIDVNIKEGEPKQFLYIATGVVNEKIYIYSDSIENDIIDIQIVDSSNNILYDVNVTSNLYLINNVTDYYCEILNSPDDTYIYIMFGDDITSKRLSVGERVLITYADTKGSEGNITSSNVITVIKDALYDEDNTQAVLYITNTDNISGGSEVEGIESIRNNANNLFQAGMLLSSLDNWKTVIESASYVYKSVVWTVESLGGSTVVNDQNIVYVSIVSNTGEELTAAQEATLLEDVITPKKCLTEVVSFQTLQKIYVRFDITAKIQNKTISIMDQNIKTALSDNYGVLSTDFQTNIYESNYYRIIDEVDDVVYHSTQIYYMEKNIDASVSNDTLLPSYTSSETSVLDNQCYLVSNSFEIWIKLKIAGVWNNPLLIATSTGTTISAVAGTGFTISGGYVNYTYNQYSFNIPEIINDITHTIYGIQNPGDSDNLGYVIFISYKMEDGNGEQSNSIRLPYFYQITDIDESFIDTDLSYA
jgi:hypothetical protein